MQIECVCSDKKRMNQYESHEIGNKRTKKKKIVAVRRIYFDKTDTCERLTNPDSYSDCFSCYLLLHLMEGTGEYI